MGKWKQIPTPCNTCGDVLPREDLNESLECEKCTNSDARLRVEQFLHPVTQMFVVVKFWGNKSLVGGQTLEYVTFSEDDAAEIAEMLNHCDGWIHVVVPVMGDLGRAKEKVRAFYRSKGVVESEL